MAILVLMSCVGLVSACKKDPSIDQPIWQNVTDTSIAIRNAPVSFAIGTKVYLGLGRKPGPPPTSLPTFPPMLKDFWVIDLTTKKWQKLTDFPDPGRYYGSGFTINGRGYVAGGYDANNFF